MRRYVIMILVGCLLLGAMVSCGGDTAAETETERKTEGVTNAMTDETNETNETSETIATATETETEASPVDPALWGDPDVTYPCGDGSILRTYGNKTAEDLEAVCAFYRADGYTVYTDTTKNGSRAATYVKGAAMAHLYWFSNSRELSVVTSEGAGATLPPVTPAVVSGDHTVSVTQMGDTVHVNGMGYIIRLADGSFIVYDGAYAEQAEPLVQTMESMCDGNEKPLIRAWVLTHAHGDHYLAFRQVAQKLSERVQVEYVLVAPIDEETAQASGETYFHDGLFEQDMAKLTGARAVYVHTGMEFTFCNLKLEILLSPDDLYKVGKHGRNFNNSSIVSRVYDESYSALFLGDTGIQGATLCSNVYGDYLQSDICQVAHHGVEDVPLSFYLTVRAAVLYYPCSQELYDANSRNNTVRRSLECKEFTKEILIAGLGQYTVEWGRQYDPSAAVIIRDHPEKS